MRKKTLPFVTTYHPALQNLKNILMSKWHLIQDQPLPREIYNEYPIISNKREQNRWEISSLEQTYKVTYHTIRSFRSRAWPAVVLSSTTLHSFTHSFIHSFIHSFMVHRAILSPAVAFTVLQTHLRRLGTRQFI